MLRSNILGFYPKCLGRESVISHEQYRQDIRYEDPDVNLECNENK
jgi:hypothetical protein